MKKMMFVAAILVSMTLAACGKKNPPASSGDTKSMGSDMGSGAGSGDMGSGGGAGSGSGGM